MVKSDQSRSNNKKSPHRQPRNPTEPIRPDIPSESLLASVAQTPVVTLFSLPALRTHRASLPRRSRQSSVNDFIVKSRLTGIIANSPESSDARVAGEPLVSLTDTSVECPGDTTLAGLW